MSAAANDTAMTRFLFAILSQKSLKDIDWDQVANSEYLVNRISSGHAARMRFSRFKQVIMGVEPKPRARNRNPADVDKSRVTKGNKKDGGIRPRSKKDKETNSNDADNSNNNNSDGRDNQTHDSSAAAGASTAATSTTLTKTTTPIKRERQSIDQATAISIADSPSPAASIKREPASVSRTSSHAHALAATISSTSSAMAIPTVPAAEAVGQPLRDISPASASPSFGDVTYTTHQHGHHPQHNRVVMCLLTPSTDSDALMSPASTVASGSAGSPVIMDSDFHACPTPGGGSIIGHGHVHTQSQQHQVGIPGISPLFAFAPSGGPDDGTSWSQQSQPHVPGQSYTTTCNEYGLLSGYGSSGRPADTNEGGSMTAMMEGFEHDIPYDYDGAATADDAGPKYRGWGASGYC